MDPQLAAAETKKIQTEIAGVAGTINQWETSQGRVAPLNEEQVRQAIGAAGDLVRLLEAADRADRAELYRALGVQLRYIREAATGLDRVQARLQLRSSGGRI